MCCTITKAIVRVDEFDQDAAGVRATEEAKYRVIFSRRRTVHFSLPMACPIRARPVQSTLEKKSGLSFLLDLYGMTSHIDGAFARVDVGAEQAGNVWRVAV